MNIRTGIRNAAACAVVASTLIGSTAVAASNFTAVVERVIISQQDGRVSKLDDATKRELASCVNAVLDKLPAGKKRFIAEAASFDEMQDRFGKVVMENRAEWKQKIAGACARIVLSA